MKSLPALAASAAPSPSGRLAPKNYQDETIALEIITAVEDTPHLSEAEFAATGL